MTLQDKSEHVSVSLSGVDHFLYDCMCMLHDGQLCKGHRQTHIYFIEVTVIFLKLFTIINSRKHFHNYNTILEV
jgi:hypothetical protein